MRHTSELKATVHVSKIEQRFYQKFLTFTHFLTLMKHSDLPPPSLYKDTYGQVMERGYSDTWWCSP